ncbi:uncharacterized protein METZ01_LOCUS452713, partial [marine metagenome]
VISPPDLEQPKPRHTLTQILAEYFRGLGLLLNLKFENPLRKTVFISGGDAAVK